MNPTTLISQLDPSLTYQSQAGDGVWSPSGPVKWRPSSGSRINWVANSCAAVNTTGAAAVGGPGAALSRASGLAYPELPDDVTTAFKLAMTGAANNEGMEYGPVFIPLFPDGWKPSAARLSVYLWADSPITLNTVSFRLLMKDGTAHSHTGPIAAALTTTPQKFVTGAGDLSNASKDLAQIGIPLRVDAAHGANAFYATAFVLELRDAVGDWFDAVSLESAMWLDMFTGIAGTAYAAPSVSDAELMLAGSYRNLVPNPYFAVNATGWSGANGTVARTTTRPYRGPGIGTLTATGASATASIDVDVDSGSPCVGIVLLENRDNTSHSAELSYGGLPVGSPVTIPAGGHTPVIAELIGTGSSDAFAVTVSDSANGDVFGIAFAGVIDASADDDLIAEPVIACVPDIAPSGTIVPGSSWDATAHQSPSTRAAASAAISPTGILSPAAGSLAFRFTRKIDTGSLEPIIECGENAAGYDHLQMFIDSDTLWVAWDSDGALPISIDTGQTIAVDTEYFIYTYWTGLTFGISVNNGTVREATRNLVTGDWGSEPFTLKAS